MNFFLKIGVFRYGFSFVFSRKLKNKTLNVQESVHVNLSNTDYKVFNVIKENPTYRLDEIASTIKQGTKTVFRSIKKLKDAGKIIRIGSDRAGNWMIIEKEK